MTNLRAEGSGVRAEREMCRSETASRGTRRAESRSRPHAAQGRRLERVKARGHALACPPPGRGQRSACCSVWSLASAGSARLNKRLQTLLLAVLEEGEHLPGGRPAESARLASRGRVGAPGLALWQALLQGCREERQRRQSRRRSTHKGEDGSAEENLDEEIVELLQDQLPERRALVLVQLVGPKLCALQLHLCVGEALPLVNAVAGEHLRAQRQRACGPLQRRRPAAGREPARWGRPTASPKP